MVQSGVLVALASYAVYAWADAIIKGLGRHSVSIYEIGLTYTAVSLVVMAFVKPAGDRWRDTFRFRHPWFMLVIAALRVTSSVSVTYAFTDIPLAEAYCIIFLIPVLITILSVAVLKEDVGWERWLLVLVSFAGVLLVVRPGFRELQLGHIAALVCACADAGATTLTRKVSHGERRISLLIAPTLCTFLFNGGMLAATGFVVPSLVELVMMLVCGVFCGAGYALYVAAIATTPASRVAPMLYSQIAWALVLGAAFFREVPDALALAGLAIIVAAGIAAVFSDQARARLTRHFADAATRKASIPPDPPLPPPDAPA